MRRLGARTFARFIFRANTETEQELLASLPGMLDRVDGWIETGLLNGDELNAADFVIASEPGAALLPAATLCPRSSGGRRWSSWIDSCLSPMRPGPPTLQGMCRNIRTLHNFEPPATEDEVRAAALQYVRKVSGSTKPSQANARRVRARRRRGHGRAPRAARRARRRRRRRRTARSRRPSAGAGREALRGLSRSHRSRSRLVPKEAWALSVLP